MADKTDKTVKTVSRWLAIGTPIVIIDSHDHPHTRGRICGAIEAKNADDPRPLVSWNLADGFGAINDAGAAALAALDPQEVKAASAGPHVALHVARKLADGSILVLDNLHWFWSQNAVIQALQNLRDEFKASRRAVVALTLGGQIPPDLLQNVSYYRDPLPDTEILAETVCSVHKAFVGDDGADLEDREARLIARELRSAGPFLAEQLTAQSLTKSGIDRGRIRENATKQINDTPGLHVESTGLSFADIGGLTAVVGYMRQLHAGPTGADLYVRIEEIEKALAGAGTDSSGTSGDALGVLLTAMEDLNWSGILAYGVSGCGKSLLAKACANEFNARGIRWDLNACKGSLVGESERQIRQAVDILYAIGGPRVFIIASMNEISTLPPELRRRFSAGTWYFDTPAPEHRPAIWEISARQFGISWDGYDADLLTGADIRDICQRAYQLACSTTDAARYHVPLCKAAPDAIAKSRQDADGRYLCANHGGSYRQSRVATTKTTTGRQFDISA